MIVEQDYWNNSYSSYKFNRLSKDDPTRQLIEQWVPIAQETQEVFELGCFPGRFLIELGQKGYILNGCDLAPQIIPNLEKWSLKNNCVVNEFYNTTYLDFIENKYDLVASFGFIEHFNNYEEVFLQQCEMVKEGGVLLVQFPNFRGFVQLFLHSFFDKDNLNNHVIESMDLSKYKKILPDNFEIVYYGYYGNFDFWIDDYNKRNGKIKNKLLSLLMKTSGVWKMLPDVSLYSPYGAIIAQKKAIV